MKLDKELFEKEVEKVDQRLAADRTPIPARPLRAIIEMLNAHSVSGPLAQPYVRDLGFPVTAMNLGNHVSAWYGAHYGDKANIDPSPGRFPLWIEGAAYQCRIPLLVGRFYVVAAKGKFRDKRILNVVDHISDLPSHVRARLTGEQEGLIQAMFQTSLEVTKEFRDRDSALLKSASSDFRVSCDLLCGYDVNPSLSAWHSLQFAEKVLKEYIGRYVRPPLIHEIAKLMAFAQKYGYVPDTRLNLGLFNFGASVRYDPKQVRVDEAILINHEAWRVAFNVLKQA